MTLQSPGMEVIENRADVVDLVAAANSVGAFIGAAERGPIHTPVLITGKSMFKRIFGGAYAGSYLYEAVMGFFDNGGARCYVVRAAYLATPATGVSTADGVKAFVTLSNSTPTPSLTFRLASQGAFGNFCSVVTKRRERLVGTTAAATGTSAITSLGLTSTQRVRKGDTLRINDGVNTIRVVVSDINGSLIIFPSVTPSASVASGANVYVETLDVTFMERGQVVQNYTGCRMSSLAGEYYIENMITNLDDPERSFICEELGVAPTATVDPRPVDTTASGTAFSSGADGTALNDLSVVGDSASKTGFYAFDRVKISMLSAPGWTSAVIAVGLQTYQALRQTVICIVEPPSGSDPSAVLTWLNTTTNIAGDNLAVYYPWVKIADINGGPPVLCPPSGHIQGVYARVERKRNLAKSPAGMLDGKIQGIMGLERVVDTGEYDTLYPEGVNCLLVESNGYSIMGDKTLGIAGELGYVNKRRVANNVIQTVKDNFRWLLFENNDEDLQARFDRSLSGYLIQQWEAKNLDGKTARESFYINAGEDVNTEVIKRAKRFKAKVGLRHKNSINFAEIEINEDLRALQAELTAEGT